LGHPLPHCTGASTRVNPGLLNVHELELFRAAMIIGKQLLGGRLEAYNLLVVQNVLLDKQSLLLLQPPLLSANVSIIHHVNDWVDRVE